ncbi:hypothetical protein JTB14_005422 [Gonioctena quinquepunctata]|nr:hypothetical protein JTB14_005422 [Gonioctena quinquepunctata]
MRIKWNFRSVSNADRYPDESESGTGTDAVPDGCHLLDTDTGTRDGMSRGCILVDPGSTDTVLIPYSTVQVPVLYHYCTGTYGTRT